METFQNDIHYFRLDASFSFPSLKMRPEVNIWYTTILHCKNRPQNRFEPPLTGGIEISFVCEMNTDFFLANNTISISSNVNVKFEIDHKSVRVFQEFRIFPLKTNIKCILILHKVSIDSSFNSQFINERYRVHHFNRSVWD